MYQNVYTTKHVYQNMYTTKHVYQNMYTTKHVYHHAACVPDPENKLGTLHTTGDPQNPAQPTKA